MIHRSFESELKQEIEDSKQQFELLKSVCEANMVMAEYQYSSLSMGAFKMVFNKTLKHVEKGDGFIMLDSFGKVLSASSNKYELHISVDDIKDNENKYVIHKDRTIEFLGYIEHKGGRIYIAYYSDISSVFDNRDEQLRYFLIIDIIAVCVGAALALAAANILTRPIMRLKLTAGRITRGGYHERVKITSKDEIGELAEQFNEMAEAVEQNVYELELYAKKQEDFVANFAHELKTPMTSIIGYADMLRSKKLSDDAVFEAASFIFSEGKRLESLSLKLMDLIVLSKQDFELETIDIYELIEKVRVAVIPIMQKYSLELKVYSEHCVVIAEQDLLKTLLINLIDNARKASEKGAIELHAKKEGNKCRVTVKDRGRGMDEAELSRITEAFYMVDKSRSRAQHGAGLGLAICERIAGLHGTGLEFSSAVGKGTSVSIELEVK